MPELLRVKGEVLLSLADTTVAADHFHRSLVLAHRQSALSWALRAAMSRSNVLYLGIGALLVAVAALGYQLYEAKKEPKGVQLNIGERGISIETK